MLITFQSGNPPRCGAKLLYLHAKFARGTLLHSLEAVLEGGSGRDQRDIHSWHEIHTL